MANVKISDLPAAASAGGTDQLETNQGGTSRRLTVAQVATHVRSTATDTVVVAAGSAAAPSIAPTGDSNTGIFFPAADTIAFSEGGVEALRLDSSGNATFAGTAAMASSFLRNRIINGDMRIAQRGTSAVTFDTNNAYIVDRWTQNNSGGATLTGQQSATAPAGFTNSLLVTVTSGGAPSAAQLRVLRQKIEGFNTADLGWGTASAQTVTASFWVRSSITGTFACYVTNASYNRSQVQTFSISASNTWEYKTVSFSGDTGGTWDTSNGIGVELGFDVGSGSNFNATAGVWNAALNTRTSGAVTLSSTTSNTLFVTGVQLEVGSAATPFERRQYGQELALCQRYAYAWGPGAQQVAVYSSGLYSDANQITMLPLGINVSGMRSLSATITAVGTQGTDWLVQTAGGVNQTGFTLGWSGGMLFATKAGHGITNGNCNLQVVSSSGRIIVATEL